MWSLCTMAFFTMARKSNLVASKLGDRRQVQRWHIQGFGCGLLVLFKWSKTIQFHQRRVVVPVAQIENSVLCPVKAYSNMVAHIPDLSSILLDFTRESYTSHIFTIPTLSQIQD